MVQFVNLNQFCVNSKKVSRMSCKNNASYDDAHIALCAPSSIEH